MSLSAPPPPDAFKVILHPDICPPLASGSGIIPPCGVVISVCDITNELPGISNSICLPPTNVVLSITYALGACTTSVSVK